MGSACSPIFFNLYMQETLNELSNFYEYRAYADDLVFMMKDMMPGDVKYIIESLEKVGLKVNLKKSAVLLVRGHPMKKKATREKFAEEYSNDETVMKLWFKNPRERVLHEEFVYLGMKFGKSRASKSIYELVEQKIRMRMAAFNQAKYLLGWRQRENWYNVFIVPPIVYAIPMYYNKKDATKIWDMMIKYAKMTFNLPINLSKETVQKKFLSNNLKQAIKNYMCRMRQKVEGHQGGIERHSKKSVSITMTPEAILYQDYCKDVIGIAKKFQTIEWKSPKLTINQTIIVRKLGLNMKKIFNAKKKKVVNELLEVCLNPFAMKAIGRGLYENATHRMNETAVAVEKLIKKEMHWESEYRDKNGDYVISVEWVYKKLNGLVHLEYKDDSKAITIERVENNRPKKGLPRELQESLNKQTGIKVLWKRKQQSRRLRDSMISKFLLTVEYWMENTEVEFWK